VKLVSKTNTLDILSLLAGNVSLDKDLKAFYANSTGLTQ